MATYQLVCPQCHDGKELHVLEITRFSRAVPDVTTNHTEYGDESSDPTYQEVGIQCRNCGWERKDTQWRLQLEKGPELPED